MDKSGTIRLGVSNLAPYTHGFIGIQIADPLYVSIRQTAEISSLGDTPNALYPGFDFKLRLKKESRWSPEISLGMNSAVGHSRTASEYLSLSKRYNNFDFTAGIAWGRLGSAGHIKNPLSLISGHFDYDRDFNSELPNDMNYWFTGPDVGLFAGLEYFTPLDGLSLKAEWGADRYTAERETSGFQFPSPWSVGINYAPMKWANLSAAMVGTDKIMARLSLQHPVEKWSGKPDKKKSRPPANTIGTSLKEMKETAQNNDLNLYAAKLDGNTMQANLELSPYTSPSSQIGQAARYMAAYAGQNTEALKVTPHILGLKGPEVRLLKSDFKHEKTSGKKSNEEIWHNTTINEKHKNKINKRDRKKIHDFRFILETNLSLSEEDHGILYRTSALADYKKEWFFGLLTEIAGRVNIHDNLNKLKKSRRLINAPVRGNIDNFTKSPFALDRGYIGWTGSLNPEIHASLQAGLLEEMYAGAGGEILIRPFNRTLVIGAEGWHLYKRNPENSVNADFLQKNEVITGHLNMWYEVPDTDITLSARIGQYLGKDFGGTMGIQKRFDNGVTVKGFMTVTDELEADSFGGTAHAYSGLRLTLPFGNVKYIPAGSEARFNVASLGKDRGQALDKPLPLYDITEPVSYRRIVQSWKEVLN